MKTMVVLDERLIEALIDAAEQVMTDKVTGPPNAADLVEAHRQLQTGLLVLAKARQEAK
jgi:hypothetical protein